MKYIGKAVNCIASLNVGRKCILETQSLQQSKNGIGYLASAKTELH